MQTIYGNPNSALFDGLNLLKLSGVINDSRNGRVVQAPSPVMTVYTNPRERVMFSPLRDANPFFHLYEALWMLAGKNDVASVARFAKQMSAFSDDGVELWGAYGWRWRSFFGLDQLELIARQLTLDPKTRRAVMTMWTPNGDLVKRVTVRGGEQVHEGAGKDIPCNTHIYFDGTKGALDMTVCNRSNDLVWGAYGANVVHMSVLHEFMAAATGLPLGTYYQLSNNYHMYLDRDDCQRLLKAPADWHQSSWDLLYTPVDHYRTGVQPLPLFHGTESRHWFDWLMDCEAVVNRPYDEAVYEGRAPYFTDVVAPLMVAHKLYKEGKPEQALQAASVCAAEDWRFACMEWLVRRAEGGAK